jgi:hypothetical protein
MWCWFHEESAAERDAEVWPHSSGVFEGVQVASVICCIWSKGSLALAPYRTVLEGECKKSLVDVVERCGPKGGR